MTLEQAKAGLAAATTATEKADWAKIVALKAARVAQEGGDGTGPTVRVKTYGIPIGENPHDNDWLPGY